MYIPAWIHIIIMCLVFSLGMLLTYTIGVTQHHFRAVFPYISDTGFLALENGFFVLVFALTALFFLFILYIRFKDAHSHVNGLCFRIFNVFNLICGILSVFFLVSVAAFEFDDSPASNNLHFASAVLAIFINYIYQFGQVYIGIVLPPKRVWWKWVIFSLQLTMTIIGIILFFYFFGASFFPDERFFQAVSTGNLTSILTNSTLTERYNRGLTIDYSRAVVEWIIFVEVLAFFITFIPDFHRIRVDVSVTRPLDNPKKGEASNQKELGPLNN